MVRGKSTLLKILNGLIRPDTGRVTMRGRVGALIELSAGFNPILTGRENIFNQAALLGFSTKEIREKYDAIVDFSELNENSSKCRSRNSSGMKVKLGFAVSSQLEPDILLIDEVLAVGDLGFRYKCLNKIGELLRKCAVVFVSHSMTQVMRVSSDIMMCEQGELSFWALISQRVSKRTTNSLIPEAGQSQEQVKSPYWRSRQVHHRNTCGFDGRLHVQHGDSVNLKISVQGQPQIRTAVVQVLFWNHEMLPVLDVTGEGVYGFEFAINAFSPLKCTLKLPICS